VGLFRLLYEVVDSDVKAARIVRPDAGTFELKKLSDTKFLVSRTREAGIAVDVVVFELLGGKIAIGHGQNSTMFMATPSLLSDGECRLEVAGEPEPLELWQISRKALEDLFFA
jgi:hypothetical protein